MLTETIHRLHVAKCEATPELKKIIQSLVNLGQAEELEGGWIIPCASESVMQALADRYDSIIHFGDEDWEDEES